MKRSTSGHPQAGLDFHHHDLFAVDRYEVELPAPLTVVLPRVGYRVLHRDAPLLEQPYEVAFHQGLHQLAPLSVEQLLQLVHALLGGPCLPLEQLIGFLQPPVGVLHLPVGLLLLAVGLLHTAVGLLHTAVGLLHLAVGLLHTACSLLLHCGDLAQNLPDLLRGCGFAVFVAFGHKYARSSEGSERHAFRQALPETLLLP